MKIDGDMVQTRGQKLEEERLNEGEDIQALFDAIDGPWEFEEDLMGPPVMELPVTVVEVPERQPVVIDLTKGFLPWHGDLVVDLTDE
jgi:hypothetical protein